MNKNITYGELALKAMKRASVEAMEKAAANHLKIPVWENDSISLVEPNEILIKSSKGSTRAS